MSFLSECNAPSSAPPRLEDPSYHLEQITVLTRHGARSPIHAYLNRSQRGNWMCDASDAISSRIEGVPKIHPRKVRTILDNRFADYPPNCRVGELILEGMSAHENLGKSYRKYLVDELGLLDKELNPNQLFVRATAYDRTYKSAISFMKGLYEPKSINEIIDITTGTSSDTFKPGKSYCKDMGILNKKLGNKLNDYLNEVKDLLAPVKAYVGMNSWTLDSANAMCDWLVTMNCNEETFDNTTINQTHIDVCGDFVLKMFFELYYQDNETNGIAFSYSMREILRYLDDFINGVTENKFILLSSHDSTLAAYLSLLGHRESRIPYSSNLAMETYKKDNEYYVRFVFNSKPIGIRFMNDQVLVSLKDFKESVAKYIDYCHEWP